jgi:hypothetical protein
MIITDNSNCILITPAQDIRFVKGGDTGPSNQWIHRGTSGRHPCLLGFFLRQW